MARGAAAGTLEQQLELLLEDDPDPSEGHWRRAAEWLRRAEARGEDITPALALLEGRLCDSHQVPAMEAIAAALVAHHGKHGTLERLLPLARKVTYGDTVILRLVEPLTRRRGGFEATLPLLLGVLPRSSLHVLTILLERVGGSQARLDRVVAAMAAHPVARQLLPELVREAVHRGVQTRVSLKPAMPVLAELLADPGTRLQAALSLVWVVEAGVDVTALLPALEACLGDPDREIRNRAAYALALAHAAAGRWERLDALLAAGDAGLRDQAVRALGLAFLACGRRGLAETTRLAAALLDPEAEVRGSARAILGSDRVGGAVELDDETLGRLAAALDDPERGEGVGEVLLRVAESGPARARRLAALLAVLPGGRRAGQLAQACRAFEKSSGVRACTICRRIPRVSGNSEPLELLVPELPESESRDRSCPECGAYYHYSYSEEWRSPSDGMGVDIEIELRRLTPPEMRRRLVPATLAALPDYEAAMKLCRAGLEHPERYLREDCARALLLDGLEHEGFPALPGLLGHADPVVRAAAAATLHEVWLADPASFPLGRLVPALTGLLADTATAVRTPAAHMVCEHHAGGGDVAALLALLAGPDPVVKAAVLTALRVHPEVDAAPFVDDLERLLRHEAEGVRRRAADALVQRARGGPLVPRALDAFLGLADADGALPEDAARAVAELDWAGTRLAPAVLAALTATLDVGHARYHAFEALQRAARGGADLEPAFPRLLEVARDRGDTSGYRDDALRIVETALPAALRAGADVSAVLAATGELLSDPNEEVRRVAAECLKVGIHADHDLGAALPAVVAALTAPRVSYVESYLVEDVAAWLVRRRDLDTVGRLLAASPEVSGGAARVLGKAASEGLSLEPLLEPLLACLTTRSWYARDGAAVALRCHVLRHPLWAPVLRSRLASLALDQASGDVANLLAAVGQP